MLTWEFGWNFPSWPNGHWYFNPFAWQLLFVFGAWCALGGATRLAPALRSPVTMWLAIAYLLFAFGVTLTWYFPRLGFLVPHWLGEWMYPIDKTNLDVLRFAHFLALAALTVRFIPRDWPALQSPWLRPAILCGQHSLEIFCLGVFLAFAAHFVMVEFYGGTAMQVLMSVAGILHYDWHGVADLVVQADRRPRLGDAEAAAGCRPCRRRGMKTWTALGRAVAMGAIVLCSAVARGEPADLCAVPGYLLFGDSPLDRVNAAVNKDKTLQDRGAGRHLVDAAGPGRRQFRLSGAAGSGPDAAVAGGQGDGHGADQAAPDRRAKWLKASRNYCSTKSRVWWYGRRDVRCGAWDRSRRVPGFGRLTASRNYKKVGRTSSW